MIYIIHRIWVLLKNHLNYFKDAIFECSFKESNRLLLFKKKKKNSQNLSIEEEKIIKDIRNLFRHEKNKAIKDRILREIKNLFEHEEKEENYYKPVRVSNNFFWVIIMLNTKVMVI